MDLLELWKLLMDCVSWQLTSLMKKSMSFYGFGLETFEFGLYLVSNEVPGGHMILSC